MELILYNGLIHTIDKAQPLVSAVAIKDGLVFKTGSDAEIKKLAAGATEMINLEGRCVVPGFNDSHLHLMAYAAELTQVSLKNVTSIEELISVIGSYIEKNHVPEGTWVFGSGWNQDYFKEQRYPTRYDLDRASAKHPIIIQRACRHMVAVNSLGLSLSGINLQAPEVEGGEVFRDEAGIPTGLFAEKARSLINCEENKEGRLEGMQRGILLAQDHLLRHGITSIQSDDFGGGDEEAIVDFYKGLAAAGKLQVRISQQCRPASVDRLDKVLGLKQPDAAVWGRYKLGTIKILVDGSLGARTALMREDYQDDPGNRGVAIYLKEELDNIVSRCHDMGRQIAIHAIGDGAIESALDSIEKAQRLNPREQPRHAVIHCQITDLKLVERFKELNVMALVQPIFLHYDLHIAESRVGKYLASTSYAFGSYLKLGIPVAFGTDCPIESFNPFNNIYCAVARKDLKGYPEGGFYPQQCVSVEDAVDCYTMGSAYASCDEDVKGSITPGKYADLAVLSQDIFSVDTAALKDTQAVMTIINGKIVYSGLK